jgi:putative ABC transport system substrate-binding protein
MDRRRFLLISLASAFAAPRAVEAQQAGQQAGKVYRVGILHLTSSTPPVDAFRSALRDLGWLESQTLIIDYRAADGKAERLEELAAEIVTLRPDVIVTGTSGAAVAAKRATATIPIVMAVSIDPVRLGVVQSLARPGGNITGQAIMSPELSAKRLELLREASGASTAVWCSPSMRQCGSSPSIRMRTSAGSGRRRPSRARRAAARGVLMS